MSATLWLPPLIRALGTALLVVASSALAETLGPFWGALVASLPVSAGPAYLFLALSHPESFLAASALASAAANAATGLFLLTYGLLASRSAPHGAPDNAPWPALAGAVLAWLAGAALILPVQWGPWGALLLNLAVYLPAFRLLNPPPAPPPTAALPRRWFELPLRALAVAGFVSAVVAGSAALGATATGVAAVFPVSLISLLVIVRPRLGGPACAVLAASALRSMLGFGLMLLGLSLAVEPLGSFPALALALLASLAWAAGLLLLRRWRG